MLDTTSRVDALLAILHELISPLSLETRLAALCRSLVVLAGCERSRCFVSEAHAFRFACRYGAPAPAAEETVPDAVVARALESADCVVVGDATQSPLTDAEQMRAAGIGALVLAPAFDDARQPAGFLTAEFTTPQPDLSPRVAQIAQALAQLAGMAIQAEGRTGTHEAAERALVVEAKVTAALAYAGRELLGCRDTPALLERLCRLMVETLGCDCSYTLRWQLEDAVLQPHAHSGETAARWAALRLLKIPAIALGVTPPVLGDDQVIEGTGAQCSAPVGTLIREHGIAAFLCVPLRCGTDLFGLQVAVYRAREEPFTTDQQRIARGLGQLGSVALENVHRIPEPGQNLQPVEFVATVSHEIRTPLNAILGYSSLLLDGDFGRLSSEQAGIVRRIEQSAEQLGELINATLDLGRMQAGQLTLDLRDVPLADLLHDVDRDTRLIQAKPDVDCVWHVPPDLPVVRTDPGKLQLVLRNLVVNAIKYTERGSVLIDAYRCDDGVEICVADTGAGIAPEALAQIFDPFRRVGDAKAKAQSGVGLGLFIVRRLLDLLGGRISVDSGLGRGSVFHVWLPLGGPAEAPDDASAG